MSLPPLRYLSAADVVAAMPPVEARLHLAERTLVALADGSAELPAKIAIHPRGRSSFGHAMPAHLRGADPAGHDDLVGMKWVVGYPGNGAHGGPGLPTIFATVVLNDPLHGYPLAILDGGPITAARTAAISGVAMRRFAPEPTVKGRGHRVGLIGAGVQGRSHLEVIAHVLPGADLRVFDRDRDPGRDARPGRADHAGIASAAARAGGPRGVFDADVVITVASFGPVHQVMTDDWLAPSALVVPVDYATYCSADVARDAGLFLVDEIGQFLANRDAGLFDDYPDPTTSLGAAILDGVERPDTGRVVATHLGTGLTDLVFGRAIIRAAEAAGLGTVLPR